MKPAAADAAQCAQDSEQHKHEQRVRIDRHGLKRRHKESGRIAKKPATHERRRSGRDRHRKERLHAHLGHHQLDGEHHPADGRIEGGRNARACARSDQSDPLPAGMRIICPSVEPSAEPIWMIGPSRPTDAPLPIAMAEARDLTNATTGRMTPPL